MDIREKKQEASRLLNSTCHSMIKKRFSFFITSRKGMIKNSFSYLQKAKRRKDRKKLLKKFQSILIWLCLISCFFPLLAV